MDNSDIACRGPCGQRGPATGPEPGSGRLGQDLDNLVVVIELHIDRIDDRLPCHLGEVGPQFRPGMMRSCPRPHLHTDLAQQ